MSDLSPFCDSLMTSMIFNWYNKYLQGQKYIPGSMRFLTFDHVSTTCDGINVKVKVKVLTSTKMFKKCGAKMERHMLITHLEHSNPK